MSTPFGPELEVLSLNFQKKFSVKNCLGIYTLEPYCLVYQYEDRLYLGSEKTVLFNVQSMVLVAK